VNEAYNGLGLNLIFKCILLPSTAVLFSNKHEKVSQLAPFMIDIRTRYRLVKQYSPPMAVVRGHTVHPRSEWDRRTNCSIACHCTLYGGAAYSNTAIHVVVCPHWPSGFNGVHVFNRNEFDSCVRS